MINYISSIAMPLIIFIIIFSGLSEKKKTFDIFLKGAKEGIEIIINIFPTLIGLFLAIVMLRNSGVIDFIIKFLNPFLSTFRVPSEILPLAILRPISGSASIAINIGVIASVIMGSTETTIYTIAVYSSSVKIKDTRFVLWAALAADIVGMITSVVICRIMS